MLLSDIKLQSVKQRSMNLLPFVLAEGQSRSVLWDASGFQSVGIIKCKFIKMEEFISKEKQKKTIDEKWLCF